MSMYIVHLFSDWNFLEQQVRFLMILDLRVSFFCQPSCCSLWQQATWNNWPIEPCSLKRELIAWKGNAVYHIFIILCQLILYMMFLYLCFFLLLFIAVLWLFLLLFWSLVIALLVDCAIWMRFSYQPSRCCLCQRVTWNNVPGQPCSETRRLKVRKCNTIYHISIILCKQIYTMCLYYYYLLWLLQIWVV